MLLLPLLPTTAAAAADDTEPTGTRVYYATYIVQHIIPYRPEEKKHKRPVFFP